MQNQYISVKIYLNLSNVTNVSGSDTKIFVKMIQPKNGIH